VISLYSREQKAEEQGKKRPNNTINSCQSRSIKQEIKNMLKDVKKFAKRGPCTD